LHLEHSFMETRMLCVQPDRGAHTELTEIHMKLREVTVAQYTSC
jgi:hypothetical protein